MPARFRRMPIGRKLILFTVAALMLLAVIPGAWVVSLTFAIVAGWGWFLCEMQKQPALTEKITGLRSVVADLAAALRERETAATGAQRPKLTVHRGGKS